eukprot:5608156-Pyramimonas_sp.AAC.1
MHCFTKTQGADESNQDGGIITLAPNLGGGQFTPHLQTWSKTPNLYHVLGVDPVGRVDPSRGFRD